MGKLVAIAMLAACSFTMRAAPPSPPVEVAPDCSDDGTPPSLDVAATAAGVIGSIILFAKALRPRCGATDITGGTECTWVYPTTGAVVIATGAFGYSAVHGNRVYDRCHAAVKAHEAWVATKQPAAPKAPAPAAEDHTVRNVLIIGGVIAVGAVAIAIGSALESFHL
jgi:hypothetical protein